MEKWIERQRHLIDFTLSSLFRRKRKNAALVFVYMLVVFLLASVVFFVQSMKTESAAILKDAPDLIIQRMVAGRYEIIPISYLEPVRSIRGVSSVRARLWGYYYDPVVGANYTLMVPENPDLAPGKMIVGEGVSRVRLVNAGDTIEFRTLHGRGHRPGGSGYAPIGIRADFFGPHPRHRTGFPEAVRHTERLCHRLGGTDQKLPGDADGGLKGGGSSARHEAGIEG